MRILLVILLIYSVINASPLYSQITLTLEGTIVNNTEPGTWGGVNIARNVPTVFYVLIPPAPFSCRQKKGGDPYLPFFAEQRGVGVSSIHHMIDI